MTGGKFLHTRGLVSARLFLPLVKTIGLKESTASLCNSYPTLRPSELQQQ